MADVKKKTKDKLLDVAELLFAKHGITNTTGRMITAEASANVSAIKFHYGSLEGLTRAVLVRRLLPLAEVRLQALLDLRKNVDGTPSVKQVLVAFLSPMIKMSQSADPGERAFVQILYRTLFEPSTIYRDVLMEDLRTQLSEYLVAFREALPHLSTEEIVYRVDFAIGAVGHAFADPSRRNFQQQQIDENEDVETLVEYLIPFLVGGFTAPPSS